MTHRGLPTSKTAFRIGDPSGAFAIWSAGGALHTGGRWHQVGDPVIYASEHYSTSMLEKLVYFTGDLPTNQHFIQITFPAGLSYEVFSPEAYPTWRDAESHAAAMFGHNWVAQKRSVLLFVPSVVAPMETNVVINAAHQDFARIEVGLETPVSWDDRLFSP